MERAWIIATGTELTQGHTVDVNSAWLAEQLAGLGLRTERIVVIGDDLEVLCAVLQQATRSTDVLLLTGGLGPTADDLTRQALARLAGVPLALDPECLAHLREYFARRGREMPEANRVQALVPRGATVLPNRCGTAAGLALRLGGAWCFALPGVPFEMRAMFADEVAPRLSVAARGRCLRTRRLKTCGRGEAEIGELLRDLMTPGRNPEVGLTAELGIISIRITAAAPVREEADTLLAAAEREIVRRLGNAVFGGEGDTLASVGGKLLAETGQTLCTAESCTGGLLGKLLTDVPGSSAYYRGGVIAYADEIKRRWLAVPGELLEAHGAVSAAVAEKMADGARAAWGTTHALSITGVAGPGGGTAAKPVGLVYIGLAAPGGTATHEYRFGADAPRDVIRARSAITALNLLRLELLRRK